MLVSFGFSYSNAKHEVGEVYDARLGQSAKLLLIATSVSANEFADRNQHEQFNLWMQHIQRLSKANDDVATLFTTRMNSIYYSSFIERAIFSLALILTCLR